MKFEIQSVIITVKINDKLHRATYYMGQLTEVATIEEKMQLFNMVNINDVKRHYDREVFVAAIMYLVFCLQNYFSFLQYVYRQFSNDQAREQFLIEYGFGPIKHDGNLDKAKEVAYKVVHARILRQKEIEEKRKTR